MKKTLLNLCMLLVALVCVAQGAWAASEMVVKKSWIFTGRDQSVYNNKTDITFSSSETIKENNIYMNLGTGEFEGLAFQGADKFFFYTDALYQGNKGGRQFAVTNVKAGEIVTIEVTAGTTTMVDNGVAEITTETNDGHDILTLNIIKDGNLTMQMNRYNYIYNIKINVMVEVGATNMATIIEEQYNGRETTDKLAMSVSEENVYNNYKYLYYTIGETTKLVSENLLINKITTSDLFRPKGIYLGAGKSFAIKDLKKGDYVTIKGAYQNAAFTLSNFRNGEIDTENTIAQDTYCCTVLNDGALEFDMGRYGLLQSIKVERRVLDVVLPTADIYSTFCSQFDLDFTTVEDVEACIASVEGNIVKLQKVDKVPAGTGIILKNIANVSLLQVPITSNITPITDNALVGVLEATTTAQMFEKNPGCKIYGLISDTTFALATTDTQGSLSAGKAYLAIPESVTNARELYFEAPTAVEGVSVTETKTPEIYNAQGVRVAKVTAPGMYIIGGKKVVF